eukprot:6938440-Prymnesium_polylepis.1
MASLRVCHVPLVGEKLKAHVTLFVSWRVHTAPVGHVASGESLAPNKSFLAWLLCWWPSRKASPAS